MDEIKYIYFKINEIIKRFTVQYLSKQFEQYIIICKTDLEGKITYTSNSFCKLSGYTKEELIGQTHHIMKHPDTKEEVFQELWDVISKKDTWHKTIENLHKDGSTFWTDVTIFPDFDENENHIGYNSIYQDITAQKELETLKSTQEGLIQERTKDLEKTKLEVEQILSSILIPVIITENDTRQIVYANKYAEEQYDTTLDKMIGSQIQDLYTTQGQNEELVRRMQEDGYIKNLEQEFNTHAGKKFTALLSVIPIIYKQKPSYIGMVTDITKQKEIQNTIKTLLDNAGQGFLYFDKDMKIGSEFSKEALNIFGEDISQKDITTLLYKDEDDQMFLKGTLQSILGEIEMKQEILISLLQKEFKINNKYVELEYKVLNEEKFMLIVTDITAKKNLDQKLKDEQQTLRMGIEIVTTKEQFLELKKDYEVLISRYESLKTLENLPELRREIHTYKGLFAQKEMLHIVKKLHEFESQIDTSLKANTLSDDIINTTSENLKEWLQLDLSIIENILGENYFNQTDTMEISKERLTNLHKKIKQYSKSKDDSLLDELKKDTKNLLYKNIKTFFKPYEKLVDKLGMDLEKAIYPLKSDIDDIYIKSKYIPFINSLVHLFRNSIDHGIETPEERMEVEKDEYGSIACIVKQKNNTIKITIIDDGRGIDEEKIKSLAVKKGIYSQEEAEKLSEDEVLKILFLDAFSTSETITTVSGRGVGLASTLSELEKLNGKMKIKNKLGKGVTFQFTVPLD